MTLEELDAWEHRLIDSRRRTHDSKEERRIEEEYRQVHQQYAVLMLDKPHGLEALKRALFLQWFSVVEPPFLSGIAGLDKETQEKVMAELMRRVETNALDRELSAMVLWYYSLADWYFAPFDRARLLGSRSNSDPPGTIASKMASKEAMMNRGQMGEYWLSIISKKGGQRTGR